MNVTADRKYVHSTDCTKYIRTLPMTKFRSFFSSFIGDYYSLDGILIVGGGSV